MRTDSYSEKCYTVGLNLTSNGVLINSSWLSRRFSVSTTFRYAIFIDEVSAFGAVRTIHWGHWSSCMKLYEY